MSFHYKSLFVSGMALFCIAILIALFTTWDATLSHILVYSPSDYDVPLVKAISKIGSFTIITPLTLLLGGWLWFKKRAYEAIWVLITMGSCRIVFTLLKLAVGRARPIFDEPLTHAISYSFPSGHSVNSLAFLFVCYFIFDQKRSMLILCILGSLLIGWSRLALGAHWCSDVLAGWGGGLMWISFAYQAKVSIPLQNYINQYLPRQ
ncbi:phosphatase PAP2 family protein [Commensalibacter papalotli (ex Servin-Garciduenas et al. 2014)]|uniref:PA-phosphatase-like phosphoesterase n=1 Tax=Commensalibacter papalotli (ex Servin-Garciduenas et al. 2014) TaxID=1208583 RepID=W7DWK2_9PROT|nr:phosphatase PAP2 family protein [Commensalibacter papalotli (ex Servin-Garciduenas et al. 2014)]EUK19460.1 PA-phosphatase-like phosphoesterase [Commensalibacter papalotli (ex Servin-Garciduenas et al. 2014)]